MYVDEYASGFFAYLTLSELRDLLAGKVWSERFVRTWPPLEIVKSEFRKLLGVRNKMAHFRPITNRDMRVIGRFAEDLQDWTAPYRGVAEKADLGLESQAGRSRVRAMKAPLNRFAQDGNWNVGIVQGHLQLVVENHQDDDQWFARMCSILHRHGQLFTYSRLRPLKRFDFYISVQETRGRLVESLLRDLAEPPTVSESSDPEHVPSFALPQGEGILQGHVLIPHGFEIPQDLVPI
ncbi:MAG: hypothetical protein KDK35_21380 [Leptospiraceae bacterium]|nr:hypothetical protein [Leptospiraceae bacterium]